MPAHNQAKREQQALLISLYGVVFLSYWLSMAKY
jgi:hypothetical protein